MGEKVPSPCIDVCKFKSAGRCIGCGMTARDKKSFKKLDKNKERRAFVEALRAEQAALGLYAFWEKAYRKKCKKKKVDCPID